MKPPHIPILRFGRRYESLDTATLMDRHGEPVAELSVANPGLIRRDGHRAENARHALGELSCEQLEEICKRAGELFMNAALPLGIGSAEQGPEDYIRQLSATTGLPRTLVRANMAKVHSVLDGMAGVLNGLTRGLDLSVLDTGYGRQAGAPVSYCPTTEALGVVLPSNSPGVNSIWIPAIALKIPVMLKPGREEPWTPLRLIAAFIEAGCPAEAFGFYPTTHEGSQTVMESCGRAIIFGDEKTVARYAGDPSVEVHGPGWSKLILGDDRAEHWEQHLDVMAQSIAANGGRSCINASCILTPAHGRALAEALAEKLAAIVPRNVDDPEAQLAGFANPHVAHWIDQALDEGLQTPGAEDLTAARRTGPRCVEFAGSTYLCPTLVHCQSFDHPLAGREFLFPYASVVEMPTAEMLQAIGPTLVASAITEDPAFINELLSCRKIDRLNIGPLPTCVVRWDQPHEGNLFEFLYHRRAIQMADAG